ncbi:DUF4262 domain-containing protein [Frankia sp. EI5c]|uniref:DUF4262 domain-containing protein n=1 Tax=Frankia sp. EI5c TaxID=683316 RepID=UPI000FF8AD6B|nr:DUF4262 domain-containing protein [Frankia sp. EI5c]
MAAHHAWLANTIHTHGWAVQAVLDDGPGDPPYAYTIGLHSFDAHPELLVSGLPPEPSAEILNLIGERVRDRQRLHEGQRLTLAPSLTVQLRAITPLASDQLLLGANELYRDPDGPAVPAFQAVWADHAGSLPGEPPWVKGVAQPLATVPPAGRGTRPGRVWHIPGQPRRRVSRPPRLPRPRRPPEPA